MVNQMTTYKIHSKQSLLSLSYTGQRCSEHQIRLESMFRSISSISAWLVVAYVEETFGTL